jgi:hypothetical protein
MKYLPSGTIKRIHVDRQALARNRKWGGDEPAWTIQTSKGPIKCHYWNVIGDACSGKQGAKPLSCGARMYVETTGQVAYE